MGTEERLDRLEQRLEVLETLMREALRTRGAPPAPAPRAAPPPPAEVPPAL